MAANGDEQPPVGNEQINTEIVTLTRFLNEEQTKHKEATGDFTYVLRVNLKTFGRQQLTRYATDYSVTPSNSPSSRSPTTSEEHL